MNCNSQLSIPLGDIFIGQDLEASSTDPSLATVTQRFELSQPPRFLGNNVFDSFDLIQNPEIYISTSDCNVTVFDGNFNIITEPFILQNITQTLCLCKSIR